jgi:hypothetical protein
VPTIDSVDFDHEGWQQIEKKDHVVVWGDDIKNLSAVLSLEMFIGTPEISVPLSNVDHIRFLYRNLANQSGAGLISADVIKLDGVDSIQTIFKMPQPNRGFVYIGSITIPFAEFSFVIKIQCIEKGYIGLRDAVVLDKLFDEGAEVDDVTGQLKNWEQDPYDPQGVYPCMPNKSEDAKYDEDFPTHALSRVRSTLARIRETLTLAADVLTAQPFSPEG